MNIALHGAFSDTKQRSQFRNSDGIFLATYIDNLYRRFTDAFPTLYRRFPDDFPTILLLFTAALPTRSGSVVWGNVSFPDVLLTLIFT